MTLSAKEKKLKSILIGFFILAIICSFAFSTGQGLNYVESSNDSLGGSACFSSLIHNNDWLAPDTPTISKAHRHSYSTTLRNGLLRVFTLMGISGAAVFLAKTNSKNIKNDFCPVIRNLVPLKLRI